MASSRATARHAAAVDVVVVALASLLLVTTLFFHVTAAADTEATTATGDPADAGGDNRKMVLDCTMRCVTEAMGCATRCAGARPDEAPVCAAACVQADIGCLGGCGLPQPAPGAGGSPAPPALTPPAE